MFSARHLCLLFGPIALLACGEPRGPRAVEPATPAPTMTAPPPGPVLHGSASPAPAPTAATGAPAPVADPPVALIEPSEPGAPLVRSEPAFESVRKGRPLKIGSKGPEVRIVQTVLAAWNYAIPIASITGTYDDKTAAAVLSYRVDSGLDEIPAAGSFDKRAKTHGVFDAKALSRFEDRLAAKNYRPLRALDAQRGLRFHVGAGATPASALAAIFPEEAQRKRAAIAMPVIDASDDAAKAQGGVVAWLPIQAYVCGASTAADPSSCGN